MKNDRKKVIGVNWHHQDLALNFWDERESKISNDEEAIVEFGKSLDGDEVFAIETSTDHQFETLLMGAGHKVFWIHTTTSRRNIEAILNDEKEITSDEFKRLKANAHKERENNHSLCAYAIRRTFQLHPELFFDCPPADPVITGLMLLARDRLFIQDKLNSMNTHEIAIKKYGSGLCAPEDIIERLDARSGETNEIWEERKAEGDLELRKYFEEHKDHPIIKAVYWGFFSQYKHVQCLAVALIIGETYDIRRFPDLGAYKMHCRLVPIFSENGEKREFETGEFSRLKVQRNGRLKRAYGNLVGLGQAMSTGMLKRVNPDMWERYESYREKYGETDYKHQPAMRARKAMATWICKNVYRHWVKAVA